MGLVSIKKQSSVTVIIPAAGSGARMGGVYKPLEILCGLEIICYSLRLFQNSKYVSNIVISAREDKVEEIKDLCVRQGFDKVSSVVCGGKTRQESVENAMKAAFPSVEKITKFVCVHDAARPLLTELELESVLKKAFKYGSGVCACKVRDTVKRAGKNDVVSDNVDRENLWLIQTPQVFDTDIFHTALCFAKKNNSVFTDESSLVTDAGFKAFLCETSSANIKITYPEDVFLAEAIIAKRERDESK